MIDSSRAELGEFEAHLEETWKNFNILFDDLAANGGWEQQHGEDWIFADLPYHLAYCNEEVLIRGIKAGPDLPEEEQELFASAEAIGAWNTRKLGERPAGQTAAQSVLQWRETCAEIRRLLSDMTDADLDRSFWMPLFFGWRNIREGLLFTRAHEWGEFMQLRILMGREEPVPSAGVTQAYLQRMLGAYLVFFNPEAARGRTLTTVMAFSDPGVGAFTLRVADDAVELVPGADPDPDLVITQRAATFLKTLTGMHDPAEAMRSGEIQVNDFESLGVFGELFVLP